jgi:glutaminyl-tRNA synthetase
MSAATSDEERSDDGPGNFIREIVESDLAAGKDGGRVMTRFPPEPNGYLHIGHAKSICLNFGIAALTPEGVCNLRFDDTNPVTEDTEYVESIKDDVRWLGFDWAAREYYASDYFERLYGFATQLVRDGKAYVDDRPLEEIRATRGSFYADGEESPHRGRPVEESLALLRKMRAGELPDGSAVLRAKIDMQSKDVKLRDPILYRIRKVPHHRTGSEWPIYPMYDFAHGLSDVIEGVTHSICTLEFQNHRPLYDWFIENVDVPSKPRQIEFARLNLTYTVLSKRKLQVLVQDGHVEGWDDPRMPTLAGLRRRGVTPEAIRAFCDRIGVSKRDSFVDVGLFEHALREDLDGRCRRVMGVLRPLKLVLENFPEDRVEALDAPYFPDQPERGSRKVFLRREVWIDRDDFMLDPPKKWWRLAPGNEVRLRYGCLVRCTEVVRDSSSGQVIELRGVWDPDSLGGVPKDGRKVKGTIHWVPVEGSLDAEVRLYDRLFSVDNPSDESRGGSFTEHLNPRSVEVLRGCKLEPSLLGATPGDRMQLERVGFFYVDPSSPEGAPILNRTIALRDSWAKIAQKDG